MGARDILWAGTVRKGPIRERIDAAAAAGYGAISWSLPDVADILDDAGGQRALRTYAEDRGVRLAVLDPVFEWYPFAPPPRHYEPPLRPLDEALTIAARIGASELSALALVPVDGGHDLYVSHLAALADRASEHGIRVGLEFTPFAPVAGLGDSWPIVRDVGRADVGLVFDSWHFYRCGDPNFDLLEQVPGDRIFTVQISDGGPIVESVIKDTYFHRRAPLDGDFDLVRVWRTLAEIGGLTGLVGPEVLSRESHAMAPADGARWAAAAMNRLKEQGELG
jgi:sugar phosphate isomerase/epimerase